MTDTRPIEPTEAFALGALHGILKQAGLAIEPIDGESYDLSDRGFDVYGLCPSGDNPPCIRITIEEVQ